MALTDEQKKARKDRRLKRQLKKQMETEAVMKKPAIEADCIVCEKPITPKQDYGRLMPDATHDYWRYYHIDCGPGTEAWYKFHPSRNAEIMMKGKEVKKEKRVTRRERRRLRKASESQPSTPNMKGEKPMVKEVKETKKEETKKAKKGEHLKPMQPVIIPASVIKKQSKEVRELLDKIAKMEDRSSKEAAGIRKSLRKLGFKLSDFRGDDDKKETPAPKKAEAPAPTAPVKEKKTKKAAPPAETEED